MKVNRLKMNSFRGISDLTLEFDTDEPTVFIGINGVGKSSILECLAILLSWLTKRIQTPNSNGRSFNEDDIKNGCKETHNEITISINDWELVWSLTKVRKGRSQDTSSNLVGLKGVVDNIHSQLDANSYAALPLAVYYPTNRAVLDIPLKIRTKHSFEQITAYDEVLTGGRIDFRRFFEWFREREDYENELRLNDSDRYRDRQLEAVRYAFANLLDGFSNLRVRRSPLLRMTVNKQGEELIVNQLSDGEKCLLALAGDLARRLAIANPNPDCNPLEGSGVVLIDEIELHLHPKWQRAIIPNLKKTFPNCQFIITTHSPQVISDLKWVHLLRSTSEGIAIDRVPSFGKDSNRILETLMGTPERPQEIKEDLRELFRLIDKGELGKAREFRQELAHKMGEEDPEFVRADWLIQRKEIINK
ncbi:SMC domain protein [Oscillatoria nigro-viridis PCC 7112]|uniref:SMC domain protein n=1 Tax=Phormidium nigroviride PCC 7112 TaxID=179408 RepID=K9VG53_9CYAN|nr:AAA family ATPase [Oscillatoria nigro-viridis]AFZ07053.1 SMC domain protein [Oscillatoria nigro-viridis PCC 7112]